MDLSGIFSKSFSILEKSLDLRSKRHNLIASNISNMDTPGYKGFDIMVDEEISKMDEGALDWWKDHKDLVIMLAETP